MSASVVIAAPGITSITSKPPSSPPEGQAFVPSPRAALHFTAPTPHQLSQTPSKATAFPLQLISALIYATAGQSTQQELVPLGIGVFLIVLFAKKRF